MVGHMEISGGVGNGGHSFLSKIQRWISDGLCWLLDGLLSFRAGAFREEGQLACQVCGEPAVRWLADWR